MPAYGTFCDGSVFYFRPFWQAGSEAQLSFTQLNPFLPVSVEGKGKSVAYAVIDYGEEHNLICDVALDDIGEISCSPNPEVRMRANWTMGRTVARAVPMAAE